MTFEEVLAYYKSNNAIAAALNVSPARVTHIKQSGCISYRDQCVLYVDSSHKLKPKKSDDPEYVEKWRSESLGKVWKYSA